MLLWRSLFCWLGLLLGCHGFSVFFLQALDFAGFIVASLGFNLVKCLLRSSFSSCSRNLLVSSSALGAERLILFGLRLVFSPGLCGCCSCSSSCVLLATFPWHVTVLSCYTKSPWNSPLVRGEFQTLLHVRGEFQALPEFQMKIVAWCCCKDRLFVWNSLCGWHSKAKRSILRLTFWSHKAWEIRMQHWHF